MKTNAKGWGAEVDTDGKVFVGMLIVYEPDTHMGTVYVIEDIDIDRLPIVLPTLGTNCRVLKGGQVEQARGNLSSFPGRPGKLVHKEPKAPPMLSRRTKIAAALAVVFAVILSFFVFRSPGAKVSLDTAKGHKNPIINPKR